MRAAPTIEEFESDVDLDTKSNVDISTKSEEFRLPKIDKLLPGIDTKASLWSATLEDGEIAFKASTPENDSNVYIKSVDGVGIVHLGDVGQEMASIQIAYDPTQRVAYKAIVMWGDQYLGKWASQPTVVVALGENPEQIIDRATRGLYACEWGTRLLRDAVARAALVARGQVEDVPTWMVKRAVKELVDISTEFTREPDWHWW